MEIVATDVRLAGAFGVPSVAAVAPIRIFQLDRDGLADATRGFPGEVRKDLRAWRKEYPSFVRQKAPLKGILAAIAADYDPPERRKRHRPHLPADRRRSTAASSASGCGRSWAAAATA